jgi:superfamily II DNA or RNA helicase
MGFNLRPCQEKCHKDSIDYINSKDNSPVIVVAPTAFGKSLSISHLANELDHPTLTLSISKELLEQNLSKLKSFGGEASVYSASLKSKEFGHNTYATLGSIKHLGKEFKRRGVETLLIDECLHPDTRVSTDDNFSYKLITLYNKYINGKSLPKAKCFNEKTKEFTYSEITKVTKTPNRKIIKVKLSPGGIVKCTPEHLFLTTEGWKEAQNLTGEDAIINSEIFGRASYSYLNEDQRSIILGGHLGDGSIDYRLTKKSNARMRCIHGLEQFAYLEWKANILNSTETINYIEKNGYAQTPAKTFVTPSFFMKESEKNLISSIKSLDAKALAILWMDDGHLAVNQSSGSLYTLCHEPILIYELKEKLNQLGITDFEVSDGKSSSTGKSLKFIRFRKKGLNELFEVISKYIPSCMEYKVADEFKHNLDSYKWSNKNTFAVKTLDKIIDEGEISDVYDITVEEHHNFVVSNLKTLEGVVVHNCHAGFAPNAGSMFSSFIRDLQPKKVIGYTATPIRLKSYLGGYSQLNMLTKQRPSFFKDIIHVTQIKEMVENNWWTPIEYTAYKFDDSKLLLNSSGAEFTETSIQSSVEEQGVNERMLEKVQELDRKGESSLVFCDSVATAEMMSSKVFGSACISNNTSASVRDSIVTAFKNGIIKTVFNYQVLGIGFDHPALQNVLLGRATNSLAIFYQIIGRGTRIFKGKEVFKFFDYCGNVKRFGKVENLTVEHMPGKYGWGIFSNDYLLTNTPMHLKKKHKNELLGIEKAAPKVKTTEKLWFGKHEGKTLSELFEKEIGYLQFMDREFSFDSPRMKNLQKELKKVLAQTT